MVEYNDRTYLRSRFDYLSKILNFNRDDINSLNALAPILSPHIPSIIETIYKKLHSFDITKQYFNLQDEDTESVSSHTETLPTSVEFHEDLLNIYIKRILIQTGWNDIFLQYFSQVGELHGNSLNLKEDYIHINTVLGYLEHLIINTIWKMENLENKKKCTTIRAINKLFWMQNSFFTMNYGIPSTIN